MCGALHELQSCSLTSGRSGGVLHVSWTCSQPCGARGVAVHASGAMLNDTRAATNLKLIGWYQFSIDFESAPWEGSVQLKINQGKISSDGKSTMVDSEDRYSTKKASSVQSMILYDCDAEALSISIRPGQSYSVMVKWRCLPELVQFHGFRSVEVMLDTPPRSPKNCPESRGGSVRVQISLSRPVSFFMVKPRLCPRQDQSSPVKSSRPLCFGQVLSDQPAAYRQRTLALVIVTHPTPLSFLQVALGKGDRIAWCWTLGPPV
ncbi:unnamed protein product [Brassica rapa subsp. narinosa]